MKLCWQRLKPICVNWRVPEVNEAPSLLKKDLLNTAVIITVVPASPFFSLIKNVIYSLDKRHKF